MNNYLKWNIKTLYFDDGLKVPFTSIQCDNINIYEMLEASTKIFIYFYLCLFYVILLFILSNLSL